jgi:hypothetical protein
MDAGLRRKVSDRADGRCEYCQLPQEFDVLPFQVDHIRPIKHGGQTLLTNLALSCFSCNVRKGPNLSGIDPQTDQVELLFNPRHDIWSEHFRWDGPRLVGLTSQARATIEVLAINAPSRIEHRGLLVAAGYLPS